MRRPVSGTFDIVPRKAEKQMSGLENEEKAREECSRPMCLRVSSRDGHCK